MREKTELQKHVEILLMHRLPPRRNLPVKLDIDTDYSKDRNFKSLYRVHAKIRFGCEFTVDDNNSSTQLASRVADMFHKHLYGNLEREIEDVLYMMDMDCISKESALYKRVVSIYRSLKGDT